MGDGIFKFRLWLGRMVGPAFVDLLACGLLGRLAYCRPRYGAVPVGSLEEYVRRTTVRLHTTPVRTFMYARLLLLLRR
jgi:hypothetical protein